MTATLLPVESHHLLVKCLNSSDGTPKTFGSDGVFTALVMPSDSTAAGGDCFRVGPNF